MLIALALVVALAGASVGYFYATQESSPGELIQREVARLEKLVQENPDNPDLRVQLAVFYSKARDYNKAIDQLKEALRLDESHQGALITLGDIYMEQGRYQEAVEPYTKVVELNRDNPMRFASMQLEAVYYWLGVAYLELDKPQKAMEQFQEALKIAPTDADAHYQLGITYRRLDRLEEAVRSLKKATSFVPNYEEAYRALVECYKDQGNGDMVAWAQAMVKYSQGNYQEAIKELRELLLRLPNSADVYFGLGLAYENSFQPEMAIEAYRNTLRLKPDHWLAQQRLIALGVTE